MTAPTKVIAEQRFELAADNVALNAHCAQQMSQVAGPPYKIEFVVRHTDAWPAVLLDLRVGPVVLMTILTEEPRVKNLTGLLQNEVS